MHTNPNSTYCVFYNGTDRMHYRILVDKTSPWIVAVEESIPKELKLDQTSKKKAGLRQMGWGPGHPEQERTNTS